MESKDLILNIKFYNNKYNVGKLGGYLIKDIENKARYILTSNEDKMTKIISRINDREGFCPCKVEETPENICPCDEYETTAKCCCGLFVK